MGVAGIQKHLVRRTAVKNYLFIGELVGASKEMKPKMVNLLFTVQNIFHCSVLINIISQDHLVCYLSGTLALGVHNGLPPEHQILATELVNTCYETYAAQPTFLAPEITYFNLQVIIYQLDLERLDF